MELANPSLVGNYGQYCIYLRAANTSHQLDLSRLSWVYPTTLLPLASQILQNDFEVIAPINPNVKSYFELVMSGEEVPNRSGSYVPVAHLPANSADATHVLESLYALQTPDNMCGGDDAYRSQILGEITDNIYEHSRFSNGYVSAQKYERKRFVEICFFDNGITIPGSIRNYGLSGFDDTEAIIFAMNGLSTKDGYDRGFGLGKAIQIIVDNIHGLSGEVFVASGGGAVYFDSGGNVIQYRLTEHQILMGTLFSLRIPISKKIVDIYRFFH